MASNKAKGDALERRVATALRREGYRDVEVGVHFVDEDGRRSEVDVCARSPWSPPSWALPKRWVWPHLIVECKNHAKPIPLEDVAKFREVARILRLGGEGTSRGAFQHAMWGQRPLFVANGTYTPRARSVPGIRTLDRAELLAWEKSARTSRRWRWTRRAFALPLFGVAGVLALGCANERVGRPSANQLRARARERSREAQHLASAARASEAARASARAAELRVLARRGAAVAASRSGSGDGVPLGLRARAVAVHAKHRGLGAAQRGWALLPAAPPSLLAARCDACALADALRRSVAR